MKQEYYSKLSTLTEKRFLPYYVKFHKILCIIHIKNLISTIGTKLNPIPNYI